MRVFAKSLRRRSSMCLSSRKLLAQILWLPCCRLSPPYHCRTYPDQSFLKALGQEARTLSVTTSATSTEISAILCAKTQAPSKSTTMRPSRTLLHFATILPTPLPAHNTAYLQDKFRLRPAATTSLKHPGTTPSVPTCSMNLAWPSIGRRPILLAVETAFRPFNAQPFSAADLQTSLARRRGPRSSPICV